jgi:DNA ligase (NAD+)
VRVGDFVFVEKGGEIIPKITGVDFSKRQIDLPRNQYISHCPDCQTELIRKEGEAQHYCPNESNCPTQVIGKIQHFIHRKALDINSLGDETVELLFKQGLIHGLGDLFTLKYEQVIALERMAEKSALNLLEGINAAKSIPFPRVLFGLGIRYVGETVAKKLAKHFKTIDALMLATKEELLQVDEIGERIADSILEYFSKEKNIDLITQLKQAGLQLANLHEEQLLSEKLKGKAIVISGVFTQFSRDEIKHLVEQHGGKNVSSISSKTDYVVAGDNMGPAKLEKAVSLKIPILSETDFIELIQTETI